MKLNREQIIQALEFCSNCVCNNEKTNTECALINMPFCKNYLRQQALALIKELAEENERLSHHCDDCAGCTQWKCDCSNIRDEAITEFAEMLKYTLCINKEGNTEFFDYACTLKTIDQTAKEILEENNV